MRPRLTERLPTKHPLMLAEMSGISQAAPGTAVLEAGGCACSRASATAKGVLVTERDSPSERSREANLLLVRAGFGFGIGATIGPLPGPEAGHFVATSRAARDQAMAGILRVALRRGPASGTGHVTLSLLIGTNWTN